MTFTAKQLTNEAIERATDAQERKVEGWNEKALEFLRIYAGLHEEFITEYVRESSKDVLPEPECARSWGSVVRAAVKAGIIEWTGQWREVNDPGCHRNHVRLWKSLIYTQSTQAREDYLKEGGAL